MEDTTGRKINSGNETCLVLHYNLQNKDIERIITKYWRVLKQDISLCDSLPDKPKIIYKRAPNLRDRIVHNVIEPPPSRQSMFWRVFIDVVFVIAALESQKMSQKSKNLH